MGFLNFVKSLDVLTSRIHFREKACICSISSWIRPLPRMASAKPRSSDCTFPLRYAGTCGGNAQWVVDGNRSLPVFCKGAEKSTKELAESSEGRKGGVSGGGGGRGAGGLEGRSTGGFLMRFSCKSLSDMTEMVLFFIYSRPRFDLGCKSGRVRFI